MLLDADGDEADHVFAQPHLTLHLGDRRVRRVDIEEREMRLAVLADPVGERLDAPIFLLAILPPVCSMTDLYCSMSASTCWAVTSGRDMKICS